MVTNRRDVLTASAVLAAISTQALAQGNQSLENASDANRLLAAAAGCVQAGASCLDHCFGNFGDASFAACARATDQMIPIVGALLKLAGGKSGQLVPMARVAIAVCQDCEHECWKHAERHEPCKACAESCAKTIAECKRVVG